MFPCEAGHDTDVFYSPGEPMAYAPMVLGSEINRLCNDDDQILQQQKLGVAGCKRLVKEVMVERGWA